MFVDSHAHLNFPEFAKDLDEVLKRANEAGIKHIINIGTDLATSRQVIALAEKYPHLFAAVGVHPHESKNTKETDWSELELLAKHPKVVGIGEIGLDFYKDYSPQDVQRDAFIKQLEIARKVNKPIIIHSREAHQDTLEILQTPNSKLRTNLRGVAHCFSGSAEMAKKYLDLGFYISVAGPVTFPNADKLRSLVATIPVERLLLETDCPFLAPQQRRGLRNEPSYLVYCAEEFAKIYGLSVDDIARITTHNTIQLFGLEPPAREGRIAYNIRNSLYLNITNRCTSACVFCVTKFTDYVKGHNLRLGKEPTVPEIIAASGDVCKYKEVVFCGYGEPTLRLDVIKEVAQYLKKQKIKVRLDTNGQGNLINNRNILPELKGLIDAVAVSLNAPEPQQYYQICQPQFGVETFQKVLDFIREARQHIPEVVITTVTYPGVDIDKCRRLSEELGVGFRPRTYNEVG